MHSHVMPWTDRPLMTTNLVGGEDGITDAGFSVSRLVPNRVMFLEATAEFYRGDSADLSGADQQRPDLRRSASRLPRRQRGGEHRRRGVVCLRAQWRRRRTPPRSSSGSMRRSATGRFEPALYQKFIARTEMVWSRRSELAGQPQSFGTYVSGEYQFSRRWFAGARFDYADRATDPTLTDKGGSLILTYWPSEFSQIRGQYASHAVRRGDDREPVPVSVPVLDWRAWGAYVLDSWQLAAGSWQRTRSRGARRTLPVAPRRCSGRP